MFFHDMVALDGVRKTPDGYLVATARVARTGIQVYRGHEVDRPDLAEVRVYRPPEVVFHVDTLHSFAHRPVTVDHPATKVTATNWKQHAVGQTGDEVARDGDFIRVPLVVMDASAIKRIEDGKRELSMGYETTLRFDDGVTPEGEKYDAVQTAIKGNHLAVVTAARGGSHLRIGDEGEGDMADTAVKTKTITVDGLSVDTTEAGAQAIEKLQGVITGLKDASGKLEAKLATDAAAHAEAISKKDAEIATLQTKVLTGDALDKAIQARGKLIADAKRVAGDDLVVDAKSDAEIRKAAVVKKLGDEKCAGKDAAFFDHGFELLVAQLPAQDQHANDQLRHVLSNPQQRVSVSDAAEKARTEAEARQRDAWKPKAA